MDSCSAYFPYSCSFLPKYLFVFNQTEQIHMKKILFWLYCGFRAWVVSGLVTRCIASGLGFTITSFLRIVGWKFVHVKFCFYFVLFSFGCHDRLFRNTNRSVTPQTPNHYNDSFFASVWHSSIKLNLHQAYANNFKRRRRRRSKGRGLMPLIWIWIILLLFY